MNVPNEYKNGGMAWDFVEKQNVLRPGADKRPYANILLDGDRASRSPSPEGEVVTYPERVWYVIPPHCRAEAEKYGAVAVNKINIQQFKDASPNVKEKYKSQRILHYVEGENHDGEPLDRNRFRHYAQFNIGTGDELEAGVRQTPPNRVSRRARRGVESR